MNGRTLNGISALVILVALASPAAAEERVCRGTIGDTTVDNLRVPQNATCRLNGTKVKGTVKVERNAKLFAQDVVVIGNVQGENAAQVNVTDGSRVGGSVQVVQGGGAVVADSRINADILYDEQDKKVSVLRSRIGGNVQAFQNDGGVEIRRNTIDGNLQCKANNPKPVGGNNIVGGNKEDQCKNL
ncbi:MAG TPA: hypothetical protein VGA77_05810 [Propylenella sp.]